MNPPYNKTLHLQILEKVIPHCEKVVNVSPIGWLQDPYAKYKKHSAYLKFEESIVKHIKSLHIISCAEAYSIFGDTQQTSDLGIYCCDNDEHQFSSIIPAYIERIAKFCLEHPAPFEYQQKDGIRIYVQTFAHRCLSWEDSYRFKDLLFKNGSCNGKKWWQYYQANKFTKRTDEITCSIKFNTEEEAQNFLDSYNTDFMKVVDKYLVTGRSLKNTSIVWMGDYSQPWTDERFYEYFKLTKEEIDIIETTMKEYG